MQGFDTFGWQHLLWLVLLAAAGAAVLSRAPSRKKDAVPSAEENFREKDADAYSRSASGYRFPGFAAAALLAVMGRVVPGVCAIVEGSYGLASLPLHACSMAGYGCFLHFLWIRGHCLQTGDDFLRTAGKSDEPARILSELLYFPGLPGAAMALLFPGWGCLPAFSFLSCCEFLGHFGIVLYVLLSLKCGTIEPSDFRIPLFFCILYAAVMLAFDRCTGMNYGFLQLPAPDSPLSAIAGLAGGGVGYYVGYALLVLALLAGFYLGRRRD